jgi:hypothetical protein
MWDLIMASGGFFRSDPLALRTPVVKLINPHSALESLRFPTDTAFPDGHCFSRRTLRPPLAIASTISPAVADSTGHFVPFGGMFIPETLTLD